MISSGRMAICVAFSLRASMEWKAGAVGSFYLITGQFPIDRQRSCRKLLGDEADPCRKPVVIEKAETGLSRRVQRKIRVNVHAAEGPGRRLDRLRAADTDGRRAGKDVTHNTDRSLPRPLLTGFQRSPDLRKGRCDLTASIRTGFRPQQRVRPDEIGLHL